jgi:hypothetical protein
MTPAGSAKTIRTGPGKASASAPTLAAAAPVRRASCAIADGLHANDRRRRRRDSALKKTKRTTPPRQAGEKTAAKPSDLTKQWYAAVHRELNDRHGITAARVPKGVLSNLFIRRLDPAAAADKAKLEYDNARPWPKWARRR